MRLLIATQWEKNLEDAAGQIAKMLREEFAAQGVAIFWAKSALGHPAAGQQRSDFRGDDDRASPSDAVDESRGCSDPIPMAFLVAPPELIAMAGELPRTDASQSSPGLQHVADEAMLRCCPTFWSMQSVSHATATSEGLQVEETVGSDPSVQRDHALTMCMESYCRHAKVQQFQAFPLQISEMPGGVVPDTSARHAASHFAETLTNAKPSEPLGVVLVFNANKPVPNPENTSSHLGEDPWPVLASQLLSIASRETNVWRDIRRWVGHGLQRNRLVGIVLFMLLMIFLATVPLPTPIRSRCRADSANRRGLVAPFDGYLQSIQVKPGDRVTQQQILAQLDPREIDWQRAQVDAELQQLRRQGVANRAKQDIAQSQLDALEEKKLSARLALLEHQRNHLTLRSPIAGVVIDGDLQHRIGTPVSIGQSLLEIGGLGEMELLIFVVEEDFQYVRPGMKVDVRMRALPQHTFPGTIRAVDPTAVI
ncbi:MAG: efflux RND transporter periplasmic adaptor subunit, partial [Planctomycetota bacterium]